MRGSGCIPSAVGSMRSSPTRSSVAEAGIRGVAASTGSAVGVSSGSAGAHAVTSSAVVARPTARNGRLLIGRGPIELMLVMTGRLRLSAGRVKGQRDACDRSSEGATLNSLLPWTPWALIVIKLYWHDRSHRALHSGVVRLRPHPERLRHRPTWPGAGRSPSRRTTVSRRRP